MPIFSKNRNATPKSSTAVIIKKSLDWEESRTHLLEKSEARAWLITRIAALLAVLAVAALLIMIPFYTVVPVVFQVDKLTNEILQVQVGKLDVPQSEAMDKHWLAVYVQTRERYVWTLLQTDYDTTMALSDAMVANDYRAIYDGPNALQKKLGEATDIRVKLISVDMVPGAPGKASVTWERTMRQKGTDVKKERFVSSISYKYVPNPGLSHESQIIANPFGFRVDGYAVSTILATGNKSSAENTTVGNGEQP